MLIRMTASGHSGGGQTQALRGGRITLRAQQRETAQVGSERWDAWDAAVAARDLRWMQQHSNTRTTATYIP